MISYYPCSQERFSHFSILVPTWNNLPFLECCVNSIRKHSRFAHQIIVHINEGKDGTPEWVKAQGLDYTFSEQNVGVCYAVNAGFSLAKTDYIVYMNDDMYACPDWDVHLWNEIQILKHDYFFLSATLIEPTDTKNNCVLAPYDFGRTTETFDEEGLLARVDSLVFHDWQGSTWTPSVVHRKLWEMVGGLSIEFSPGMYSDPDFSMKLWQAGVRHFKGIGASKVYHFQSKSTGKVKKNNGRKQFCKKWGMKSSAFTKTLLKRGMAFI